MEPALPISGWMGDEPYQSNARTLSFFHFKIHESFSTQILYFYLLLLSWAKDPVIHVHEVPCDVQILLSSLFTAKDFFLIHNLSALALPVSMLDWFTKSHCHVVSALIMQPIHSMEFQKFGWNTSSAELNIKWCSQVGYCPLLVVQHEFAFTSAQLLTHAIS